MPVSALKVDRSFTSRIDKANGRAIVTSLVGMAHALGMTVVAEGVETADQLQHLLSIGCEAAQGYPFARPLVAMRAFEYL